MSTNFYFDLLNFYTSINIPKEYEELAKIDKYINWYLADSTNNFISSTSINNKYILELDISAAFPTLCQNIYKNNLEFITKLNEISEKKGKNIYIATTLNHEQLQQLNYLSKLIVLSIVFDNMSEYVTILEIKKDGILLITDGNTRYNLLNLNISNSNITKYLIEHGFKFHIIEHYKYIRNYKTSWIFNNDQELIIKGIFKYQPVKLVEILVNYLKTDIIDNDKLLKIYSDKFFYYLKTFGLNNYLHDFYICDNRKFLLADLKYGYANNISEINPFMYLKIFVFPILLADKVDIISG